MMALSVACPRLGLAEPDEVTPEPASVVPLAPLPPPARIDVPARGAPAGPGHGPWYYSGLDYGSESLIHPLRLIINGGFGTLQFDNRSNRIGDVDFGAGWRRVRDEMRNPIATIEINGWNDFLKREVLPISAKRKNAQYWPNYTLHLVGGGMSYVTMGEWYEQHGVAHPRWAAGATLAAYHVLNEVVEAERRNETSTDAVADLAVFDPAGILLFSHEGVNRFFGRRLHLRDWSSQPALDPATGAMENQGQNFSIKLALPTSDRWSMFYYFGNHGELGLSYARPDGSAFSAGAGLTAKGLVQIGRGVETADLVPSYGLFYDRNGSLMLSLTVARTSRYRWRMNAYPGLLHVGRFSPGVFVLLGKDGTAIAGMHFRQFPLGFAGRRKV
jgi:hypothetical protein